MVAQTSSGPIDFQFNVRKVNRDLPTGQTPFHLLMLGQFSGRTVDVLDREGSEKLFKTVLVDRDNYEDVLAKFAPTVVLDLGQGSVELSFKEFEDFEPDAIFERLELFSKLRILRKKLSKNSTFAEAAEKIDSWAKRKVDEVVIQNAPMSESIAWDDSKSFLDNVIDASESVRKPSADSFDVNELIQNIVAPYVIPKSDPRKDDYIKIVDESISELMRKILHHPDFQALESTWRSVALLVRRLETNRSLKVHVMDISKNELLADLAGNGDIQNAYFYKKMIDETVDVQGGEPWSMVVSTFQFGATKADALYLGILSRLMAGAGCPFIAAADPRLTKCHDFSTESDCKEWSYQWEKGFEESWSSVRAMPEAQYIGLVAPRFILRLPYGVKSLPVESFKFEERNEKSPHDEFLWGNGSVLVACTVAQSFSESGWNFQLGGVNKVDGLPMPIVYDDGDSSVQPCAEVLLTDTTADSMMKNGLIPILSVKHADAVLIRRYISIKTGEALLAGPWSV